MYNFVFYVQIGRPWSLRTIVYLLCLYDPFLRIKVVICCLQTTNHVIDSIIHKNSKKVKVYDWYTFTMLLFSDMDCYLIKVQTFWARKNTFQKLSKQIPMSIRKLPQLTLWVKKESGRQIPPHALGKHIFPSWRLNCITEGGRGSSPTRS